MLMRNWKDNIYFILIKPKKPGNIGAAARAIKNMDFKNLELVNPGKFLTEGARMMAWDATDILENALTYTSFYEAIKDKNIVIGTTRRVGKQRGLILPLKDSIKSIVSSAKKNRVAILFGREDRGLKNKEVEECGFLITIPTNTSSPSLNLAQSVLLVAYELSIKTFKVDIPPLVKNEDLTVLYNHIHSTLKLLEYIPRGDRNLEMKIMKNLKHLIGRTGLTDWELRMLHGICSQIETGIKRNRRED